MGADLSRIRLNALLDYAGVELKQGGVVLDADVNESMGIVDRRLRALASDVLGRATVSSTTPDAFKISAAGGTLQIGAGRLYVDGLLAENHGAASTDPAKRVFDDLMAEPVFTDPVAYGAQPYSPSPTALPVAGRHLVYLDVWNREVTHVEQPDLLEVAVGVETSSRVQTVWQVRVLGEDAGANATCATADADLPGWAALTAPSSGVLSTGTFEVAPADDPCELPSTGGFRGLENQLYRVEIQDGGQPGVATFKWSRDNGSVTGAVASVIAAAELELPSLGRDEVLRFNTGDWVEITDDVRELSQACGEIRRITVDEATHRLTFAPGLPAAMLPAAFPDSSFPATRHLRVRRWDQRGRVFRSDVSGVPVQIQDLDAVGSNGTIQVPAAGVAVLLEDGVTVTFASTGTTGFRPGDFWVFAARTADASVEILDRAPPRGIHHHYARLGIWDVPAGTVTDCRTPWPPTGGEGDCSCTACVTQESHTSGRFTIQDAVNRAIETGGTVCLGPGTYPLKAPVRLVKARSLRIRGQGPKTVIIAPTGAFAVETCVAVVIENLSILSLSGATAIAVDTALGLSLQQLVIAMLENRDNTRGAAISLQGVVLGARVRENAIVAPVAILANTNGVPPDAQGVAAKRQAFLLTGVLGIEDNLLLCRRQAIALVGAVLHVQSTRIAGNEVLGCAEPAISLLGLGAPGSSLAVRGNSLRVNGHGVRCGLDGAWIDDNKIVNAQTSADARRTLTAGIVLMPGLDRSGSDQCQILANQVSGFSDAGIRIASRTRDLLIKLNVIEQCGNGILLIGDATGAVSIENNHLRTIGPAADSDAAVIGIGVRRAETATISGNSIHALGVGALRARLRVGVFTIGVTRSRVFANDITELAPPDDFLGVTAGIMLRAPFTQFDVGHNLVQRDATPSVRQSSSTWSALLVADADDKIPVLREGGLITVRISEAQTLVLGAGRPFLSTVDVSGLAGAAGPARELARGSVLGNTFVTRGPAPAASVAVRGECLFNDNRVDARSNGATAAVLLTTDVAIVSANRVRGGEVSIRVVNARQAAVLGNVTTGPIIVPNGLPDPWDRLNLRG